MPADEIHGLFTCSTFAACVGLSGARWLVEWVVMSAAAIIGSTSGVSYSQPSIGHLTRGIVGPRGGALYLGTVLLGLL